MVAVAVGTVLSLTVGLIVLEARSDLRRQARRAWANLFGPAPVSQGQLQTSDPDLGWTNLPGAKVHRANADFDVRYHVDDDGGRRIPGHHPADPIVEILGGSFAFGEGVWDKESFGAILQRTHWRDLRVRIRASLGWGTAQSYVALKRDLERGDPISLVLYVWLPFHNSRNHLSAGWLRTVGQAKQQLPHFVVRDGRPVFDRLVGSADAEPDGTPEMIAAEWKITEALLSEMRRLCEENGARFIVVLAPFELEAPHSDVTRLVRYLASVGIEFVLAHGQSRFDREGLFFEVDGHPNARWHKLLATLVAERIQP